MNIFEFTEDNLAIALSNDYTPQETIRTKSHFAYLAKYLGNDGLGAKTIIIEDSYISKDYLHDFASYYAFCFENYPKECKRIHFFHKKTNKDSFEKILISPTNDNIKFWESYLGFIVVKPIPLKIIGYTVLKTYPNGTKFDTRNFWGLREYTVHIFGHEVSIESLAFQEQDTVLAACATTAIWTMLNKAALDFYTTLKTPSQITKDADNISSDGGRLFPNKGLNVLQICQAIVRSGLVSEVKPPDYPILNSNNEVVARFISNHYLKKIVNAYSSIGIPIILVIQVPTGGQHGLHAIVVSGYKQSPPKHINPSNSIKFLSDNIEKLYAHDDQWGPFVRINPQNDIDLITPWTDASPGDPTLVKNIVVPVFPKIRISYEDIEFITLGLDAVLKLIFGNNLISDLIWDIKIRYSEEYKKQIIGSPLDKNEKIRHILMCSPKYLWISTCYVGEYKILEFTFDATDVNYGMTGEDIICYITNGFRLFLYDFLNNNQDLLREVFRNKGISDYFNFLLNNLKLA